MNNIIEERSHSFFDELNDDDILHRFDDFKSNRSES